MSAPSRRGLFALLAGAAAAPLVAKLAPASAWFLAEPGYRYASQAYGVGYVVTREILEDDLYAKVTAHRPIFIYGAGDVERGPWP